MRPFAKVLCGVQGAESVHKQRIFLNRWRMGFETGIDKARYNFLTFLQL